MLERNYAIRTPYWSDSYPIQLSVDIEMLRLSAYTPCADDSVVVVGTPAAHAVEDTEPATPIRVANVRSFVSKDAHNFGALLS